MERVSCFHFDLSLAMAMAIHLSNSFEIPLPAPSRSEVNHLAHKQWMRPPIPLVVHDVTQCQFVNISTGSLVTCLPRLAFGLVRETL
jgi:hypothetical protein